MKLSTISIAVLLALGLSACGGSEPRKSEAADTSPPPPPPLSPAPTSRSDLESKVGPLVELAATRQGEPGRFDRLGGARFGALNSLTPSAVLWVAASRQCDKLVDVDTRQSTRDEFVWRGRCENGTVFTVFENDVQAVRPKLKGGLTEASIVAIPPPEPDDGIEPDELDWLKPCVDTFRGSLKPGESFLHDTWKLGRRAAGQRILTVSGKISTDAFHESSARFECRADVKTGEVVEIAYRAHGGSGKIKG